MRMKSAASPTASASSTHSEVLRDGEVAMLVVAVAQVQTPLHAPGVLASTSASASTKPFAHVAGGGEVARQCPDLHGHLVLDDQVLGVDDPDARRALPIPSPLAMSSQTCCPPTNPRCRIHAAVAARSKASTGTATTATGRPVEWERDAGVSRDSTS